MATAVAKGQERKEAASALRVGMLRKVVQLSDTPEELEELRGVLRGWRVLGGKVTGQTAKEIVGECSSATLSGSAAWRRPCLFSGKAEYAGRCCNLGRPDLAKEFSGDRVQCES